MDKFTFKPVSVDITKQQRLIRFQAQSSDSRNPITTSIRHCNQADFESVGWSDYQTIENAGFANTYVCIDNLDQFTLRSSILSSQIESLKLTAAECTGSDCLVGYDLDAEYDLYYWAVRAVHRQPESSETPVVVNLATVQFDRNKMVLVAADVRSN